MLLTCRSIVFSLTNSLAAMALLVLPVGDQAKHLQLARRQAMRQARTERLS